MNVFSCFKCCRAYGRVTCVTLAMDSSVALQSWHRLGRKVLFVVARTICLLSYQFKRSVSDSESDSDDSSDTSRDSGSSDDDRPLLPSLCQHQSLTRSGSNGRWVKLACALCGHKFEDRMRTPEERAASGRKRWSETPLYRLHTDSL